MIKKLKLNQSKKCFQLNVCNVVIQICRDRRLALLRVRVRVEIFFGRNESGLSSGSLAELDDVLLEPGSARRTAGPKICSDQQQDDGHVKDDHNLKIKTNGFR